MEVHDSRRQWEKQVESGLNYCGFACATYQETGLNHLWLLKKTQKICVNNSAEMEQFTPQNNPNSENN